MPKVPASKKSDHFKNLATLRWKNFRKKDDVPEHNARLQIKIKNTESNKGLLNLNEPSEFYENIIPQESTKVSDRCIIEPEQDENIKNSDQDENIESKNIESFNYIFLQESQLKPILDKLKCGECGGNSLEIVLDDQRFGLARNLILKCYDCGESGLNDEKAKVYSSERINIPQQSKSRFDIILRITLAFSFLGKGHNSLEQFSAIMNMDSMSDSTFREHTEIVAKAVDVSTKNILTECRELTKKSYKYFEFGNVDDDAENQNEVQKRNEMAKNDNTDVDCTYDGSWLTPGFKSKTCFSSVIDLLTGFVLDFDVAGKFCQECCTVAASLGADSPDFNIWYEGHADKCPIDHTGSSGAMEVSIAEKLWKRSEKIGFRYVNVLSDGDSKTYNHLVSLKVYGPSVEIKKEECVNHVSKRVYAGITNIVKEEKSRNVTLGGKKFGQLSDPTKRKNSLVITKSYLQE